jgi:hypothetical protein
MAYNIAKAAARNDAYELVRLAHVLEHEDGDNQLPELAVALEELASRLDPQKSREDLAHILTLPDLPVLAQAVEAASARLLTLGSSGIQTLLSAALSAPDATKLRVARVFDGIGEAQAAKAMRDQVRDRQQARQESESFVERARRARSEGHTLFQVSIPLSKTERDSYLFTFTATTDMTQPATEIVEAIEAEGWRLEHVGYVFEQTGHITGARLLSLLEGERAAVMGNIVGVYLFRSTH